MTAAKKRPALTDAVVRGLDEIHSLVYINLDSVSSWQEALTHAEAKDAERAFNYLGDLIMWHRARHGVQP